jgi:hypothetical protein
MNEARMPLSLIFKAKSGCVYWRARILKNDASCLKLLHKAYCNCYVCRSLTPAEVGPATHPAGGPHGSVIHLHTLLSSPCTHPTADVPALSEILRLVALPDCYLHRAAEEARETTRSATLRLRCCVC